jgi:integrase
LLFEARVSNTPEVTARLQHLYNVIVNHAGRFVADSLAQTYASARRRFASFCLTYLDKTYAEVFPLDIGQDICVAHVLLFIAHANSQYTLGTISGTLNAIADWQRGRGIPSANYITQQPQVKAMMASLARTRAIDSLVPVVSRAKAPLTIPLLRLLISHLLHLRRSPDPSVSFRAEQDMAFTLIGFFGFLRRSELAALRMRDIQLFQSTIPSESYITVFIRKSKNDQFGRGVNIYIHGSPNCGINVFSYVHGHLMTRGMHGAGPNDFVFSNAVHHGTSRNSPVSKNFFSNRLKTLLAELQDQFPHLNIDLTLFACHSLRRGGVVSAFEAGTPLVLLKAHGRWRSDAILLYLSVSTSTRLSVTARM